ncbi:MAG: hypothetical protein ACRD2X_14625 [Vicinamibacteraceae bacterium]
MSDEHNAGVMGCAGDTPLARRMWFKNNMFEHAARVPLIVCPPGGRAGHVVRLSAPCSTLSGPSLTWRTPRSQATGMEIHS